MNLEELLRWGGPLVLFAIIFAESGLFFGFFLPGDSLLITAGVLAAAGWFDIVPLAVGCWVAAVLGSAAGYWISRLYGRALFERPDSRFFKQSHLRKAEAFYDKHGGKALVIARFLPVVRTFVPIVAGVTRMPFGRFLAYNIVGALLWAVGLTLAGYLLGTWIAGFDKYLAPVIVLVVVLSILPTAIHFWRDYRKRTKGAVRRQPSSAPLGSGEASLD